MAGTNYDQIQGKDVTLKVYLNGRVIRGIPVKKFNWDADQEIRKRDLLGEPRTTNQLMVSGFTGSVEFDIDSGRRHEIVDFLNQSDKSGVPAYELALHVTERYRDGSFKRYRFVRCIFKIPKTDIGGRKDDMMSSFEWAAEDIVYLT